MAVATGETMEAEIVANYPRPPAIKPCSDHVTVEVLVHVYVIQMSAYVF
jgi:hypothetical protein